MAGVDLLDYSGWAERPEPLPAAAGALDCDVLIVGGGYCGMSAALRLAQEGADVVLAEATFCGWGASGRNAGHLTPTIAGDPQLLATVFRRRAPELVRFADAAIRHVEDLLARTGIDAAYRPVGNVSVALNDGGMRRAERITAVLARAGAHVEMVEAGRFGLPGTMRGGILERLGGTLDPGRFARGLRERVRAAGVRVFEGTPVRAIGRRGAGFRVVAPGAEIDAAQVLVATNAFTAGLPFAPKRAVAPVWVTLAETDPVEPAALEATGWTSGAGIYTQHLILESFRLTERGTIAFGTRKVERAHPPLVARRPDGATVAELERCLAERFPSLAAAGVHVRRSWGGWIAMTPSWLPVAGRTPEGVHYAVGFNGHGVAQAPYAGHLMADVLSGRPPEADLELLWRTSRSYLPAPLFSGPLLDLGWRIDRLTDRLTVGRARA